MEDETSSTGNALKTVADYCVFIVGAGVVGQAIAQNHLRRGFAVTLIEQSADRLQAACQQLASSAEATHTEIASWQGESFQCQIMPRSSENSRVKGPHDARLHEKPDACKIVIESIIEKREPKQAFFALASTAFDGKVILGTNTSTLPLSDVFCDVDSAERSACVGLHFFMPVVDRPLIEVVRIAETSDHAISEISHYARLLGKSTLVLRDSPGFIVNRMLVPYLNESLHLLCSGASAELIQQAATEFGMPMSPLVLMDWIGMATNFHAGRAFWQAFPKRIEPSPLMPAMLKRNIIGRASGVGFFAYENGNPSRELAPPTAELVEQYTRHGREWTLAEVKSRLMVPMLLEAAFIMHDRVAESVDAINLAMCGGLGFRESRGTFLDQFEDAEWPELAKTIESLKSVGRRYEGPANFVALLESGVSVSQALADLKAQTN